jgi:hypothetical protein
VRRSNPLSYGRLRAVNKPWGLVDARASFLGLVRRKLVSDSRFEPIALQLQVSAWGFRFAKLLLSFTLDSSGLNGPQDPRVFWTCSLLVKRVRASTGLAGTTEPLFRSAARHRMRTLLPSGGTGIRTPRALPPCRFSRAVPCRSVIPPWGMVERTCGACKDVRSTDSRSGLLRVGYEGGPAADVSR